MDGHGWQPTKYVERRGTLRAGAVSPASRLMADLVAEFYATSLPENAHGDLLDLGCGQAPLYGTYRSRVSSVTTGDWKAGPHVDHVTDLTAPLSFDDAAFDTVILSDVLEHLPNPALVLSEAHRLLRPGGTLLVNVPFLYGIHEAPYDFHRYTEFALRKMIDDAGLTLVEIEPLGGLLEVLSDLVGKGMTVVPGLGSLMAALVHRLTWMVHSSPVGAALRSRTAAFTPSGYALVARR
ncbi:class I SAM-dependent methyltransferase [Dermatophilaceae bacterium Soc4.6]